MPEFLAGAARLELATPGFGDQCSTNWATPLCTKSLYHIPPLILCAILNLIKSGVYIKCQRAVSKICSIVVEGWNSNMVWGDMWSIWWPVRLRPSLPSAMPMDIAQPRTILRVFYICANTAILCRNCCIGLTAIAFIFTNMLKLS